MFEQLKSFVLRKFGRNIHARYPQYKIGRGTYGNPRAYEWGEGTVLKVGVFCSFAPGVQIFLGREHGTDWVTTYPFSVRWDAGKHISGHPRSMGNVLIGSDAVIMSGVHIGSGAVIGARSVVTKNVPPYSIVTGNPAVVRKRRFPDEVVAQLLEIEWWNWSDRKIEKFLPFLLNNQIEKFIELARSDQEQ